MKRQKSAKSTNKQNDSMIPPHYEDVFQLTRHLIHQQSSLWSEYMKIMEFDAQMVEQNSFALPPQNHTVENILNEFKASYKAPKMVEYNENGMIRPQQTVDDELGRGILELFNATLPSKLQHRHEHLFYQDYMSSKLRSLGLKWDNKERCTCEDKKRKPNKQPPEFLPSQHFGTIHLFRLFYRLPTLLPLLRVQPEALELVYSYVYRLMEFVLKNRDRFYDPTKDYRLAQSAYLVRSDTFHSSAK